MSRAPYAGSSCFRPDGLAFPRPERPTKLRRVTNAGAIFDRLYADILALRMPPGMLLQEKRIAEEFNVSRTPVREALLRLSEGGLVDIYPQSGTVVSRVPVSAIPEAVVVRKSLEGTTVERAAEVATAADIDRLNSIISRQRSLAALGDTSAFHEEDEAFHEAVAEIAGYPGIWTISQDGQGADRPRPTTDAAGSWPHGQCRARTRAHS